MFINIQQINLFILFPKSKYKNPVLGQNKSIEHSSTSNAVARGWGEITRRIQRDIGFWILIQDERSTTTIRFHDCIDLDNQIHDHLQLEELQLALQSCSIEFHFSSPILYPNDTFLSVGQRNNGMNIYTVFKCACVSSGEIRLPFKFNTIKQ